MATLETPYSTAMQFVTDKPTWLNEYDAQRLAAYNLYESMFRNSPDQLTLLLRGADDKPIFVPTAKKLVNTFARYVLRDYGIEVVAADNPETGETATPSDEDVATAEAAFGKLLKRTRFITRLAAAKKQGLYMGDFVFYVQADPMRAPGSRIELRSIDPRTYFPMFSDWDIEKVVGGQIIEQYLTDDNKPYLRVLRFVTSSSPLHPNYDPNNVWGNTQPIARDLRYLSLEDWETQPKPFTDPINQPPAMPLELVPGIFHLPLYHIRVNEEPANPFGVSILSGIESVVAGINQAWTDEDMALAMAGLGMYWTNSGSPVDGTTGEPVDWQLGPSRVVEVGADKTFNRVTGVPSVEPSQNHIQALDSETQQTLGINDVATGEADPAVAESGVALAIRMGPLLDATGELDTAACEVLDQMWYNMREFFAVYEQIQMLNVTAISSLGDKLPIDRDKRFAELKDMFLDGVIDLPFFHEQLTELFGYNFPPSMINALIQVQEETDRLEAEAGAPVDDEEEPAEGDEEI